MALDVKIIEKNSGELDVARKLYELVFEDPKEYTDYLFDEIVPKKEFEILGGFVEGELVSMMCLRHKHILYMGHRASGYYIYGVATHPDHRKKGYMSELMECALSYCGSVNAYLTYLIPVDEKRYESMGFVMARYSEMIPLMEVENLPDNYVAEIIDVCEDNSHCEEILSFFAIKMDGVKKCITIEKNEEYFEEKLRMAKVDNAKIYVVRNKELPEGVEDIEAIVLTERDTDNKVYVTDVICESECEECLKYAKVVVDKDKDIMPFVKIHPVMIYNWTENSEICVRLNEVL